MQIELKEFVIFFDDSVERSDVPNSFAVFAIMYASSSKCSVKLIEASLEAAIFLYAAIWLISVTSSSTVGSSRLCITQPLIFSANRTQLVSEISAFCNPVK